MISNDAPAENLFRIEGEYWTNAFDGQICRLRDTKGLRYVAHLLRLVFWSASGDRYFLLDVDAKTGVIRAVMPLQ